MTKWAGPKVSSECENCGWRVTASKCVSTPIQPVTSGSTVWYLMGAPVLYCLAAHQNLADALMIEGSYNSLLHKYLRRCLWRNLVG